MPDSDFPLIICPAVSSRLGTRLPVRFLLYSKLVCQSPVFVASHSRGCPSGCGCSSVCVQNKSCCGPLEGRVSDRGPQFISHFWRELCRQIGATTSLSSGFSPQTIDQMYKCFLPNACYSFSPGIHLKLLLHMDEVQ